MTQEKLSENKDIEELGRLIHKTVGNMRTNNHILAYETLQEAVSLIDSIRYGDD